MQFIPSPNFNDRKDGKTVRHLILHYTDMLTAHAAIERLCDPQAEVSAHYVVDFDGTVSQLVNEKHRAWHAGKSFWAGETDINSTSIGIEICNPGHLNGYIPFASEQISAVIHVCQGIILRHSIQPQHVLGHSDIAIGRKIDPGELFPWAELAAHGVGLWPENVSAENFAAAEKLADYGYDTSNLPAAITAFQRHFRPAALNGEWDAECGARLAALLAMIKRV